MPLSVNCNLGSISHRFRDIASFRLNFLPHSFNPKFANVPVALDR